MGVPYHRHSLNMPTFLLRPVRSPSRRRGRAAARCSCRTPSRRMPYNWNFAVRSLCIGDSRSAHIGADGPNRTRRGLAYNRAGAAAADQRCWKFARGHDRPHPIVLRHDREFERSQRWTTCCNSCVPWSRSISEPPSASRQLEEPGLSSSTQHHDLRLLDQLEIDRAPAFKRYYRVMRRRWRFTSGPSSR